LHGAETLVAPRERQRISGGGIALSIDLTGDKDGLIGYRGKHHTAVVDVDKQAQHDIFDFWEPLYSRGRHELILDPDEFYILVSAARRSTSRRSYAAEMTPFDPLVGEFRVHYAGFFDPGFGHSEAPAARGSRAVLEVRSHEVPFILEARPDRRPPRLRAHAGTTRCPLRPRTSSSNYQAQGLKLSKHFRIG
jgi:dCTP deaminase